MRTISYSKVWETIYHALGIMVDPEVETLKECANGVTPETSPTFGNQISFENVILRDHMWDGLLAVSVQRNQSICTITYPLE